MYMVELCVNRDKIMVCEKDWIDVSTALLTPVVTVLGSIIAIQQWKINKKRLKHEIFDRKFFMFEATTKFINAVLKEVKVEDVDRHTFLSETKGALFIFKPEIVSYLDTVHKKALELTLYQRKKDMKKENEIAQWFGSQLTEIDEIFKQHISIES